MKSVFVLLALTVFITGLALAQNAPRSKSAGLANQSKAAKSSQDDDNTITFDSALVNTHVAVRDEKGRFVTGLTKDDFIVLDDGKEQSISYFSQEADQPLTVALVIDRSRSVQSALNKAQVAARDFFSSVLRAGKDRATVVAFDSGVYVVQDFTDDASALTAASLKLTAAGGTSIFDAVYKTTRDKLREDEEGRRIILLITDGDDTTSRASIEQAIEMALKNNVIIYAIRVPGDGSLNVRDLQGRPVLDRLTEATGGRQFHIDRDEQLAGFFTKLQDELRSQYSIGYQFQAASSDHSFHKLAIKLKQATLKAFTRRGYYSREGEKP
ncbi:MAG TPA: VWA domain-containing protein [Blastocatellia bacterium]|nr:VWA domain-containing protein [Blastocatellia bacterium]